MNNAFRIAKRRIAEEIYKFIDAIGEYLYGEEYTKNKDKQQQLRIRLMFIRIQWRPPDTIYPLDLIVKLWNYNYERDETYYITIPNTGSENSLLEKVIDLDYTIRKYWLGENDYLLSITIYFGETHREPRFKIIVNGLKELNEYLFQETLEIHENDLLDIKKGEGE